MTVGIILCDIGALITSKAVNIAHAIRLSEDEKKAACEDAIRYLERHGYKKPNANP